MTTVDDGRLFMGGPPEEVERWIGLTRPGELSVAKRIFFFVLIGWFPLLDLALVQNALGEPGAVSFMQDFGVHARMLVAIPLLVCAEAVCLPRLGAIADEFLTAGLIKDADRGRFAEIRRSTTKLRDSPLLEVAVVVLAYALVIALAWFRPSEMRPAWQVTEQSYLLNVAIAGWWHLLVSLPLVLILVLGWLWRIFRWARFLIQTSQLDLRLNASHPDGAGGLGFVGYSVQTFAILGAAFGAIVAGAIANQVTHHGALLLSFVPAIVAVVVIALVLFCGPLAAFSWRMLLAWRRGVFAYGALARDLGERFETKWFVRERRIGPEALEANDFSATTDLYSIVANVYRMRMVPMGLSSLIVLVGATLAPFLPLVLLKLSLSEVLRDFWSLLM